MKTSVTFTNSLGQREIRDFEVFPQRPANARSRPDFEIFFSISGSDWEEEEVFMVEKVAAKQCGIEHGQKFYIGRLRN